MESADLKLRIDAASFDPKLEPNPFAPLDEILDAAEEHLLLPAVLSVCEPALKAPGVHEVKYYLYGMTKLRSGDADAAYKALVPLMNRIDQGGNARAHGLLGARALEYAPRQEAAIAVAKTLEGLGLSALEPEMLQRAYDNFPDEPRLAYLMGESAAARAEAMAVDGNAAAAEEQKRLALDAREYWAEALDGFVSGKKYNQIEEILLKLADAREPGILRHGLNALKKMGNQGQWARLTGAIDALLPGLTEAGLVPELWHQLLHFLPDAPASANLRKQVADLASAAFPRVDAISDILNRSGVLNPEVKIEQAMKSLEPLLAFAPGLHVLHASWGVGRVKLNDGDSLIIDFVGTPGHRMSVNLARRALSVIPADDLRVLRAESPDELKRKLKEDPSGVAYLAIRQLGGEANTQEIKRVLLDGVLTSSQWTTWWKDAKAKMEGDYRFDLSQAFRQSYRVRELGSGEDDQVALPIIEPRRGIRPNLNLIRRFLEQHPDETARAARTYTGILDRWAKQDRTNAEDRMAIALQLYRWNPQVSEEFTEALTSMLQAGIEAGTFSDLRDQALIVKVGLANKDLWRDAACFALSSRAADIRALAYAEMRQHQDAARSLIVELMQDPASRPLAALSAIDLAVARPGEKEPFAPTPWEAVLGAGNLIESTGREQVRKMALGLLDPDGSLAKQMISSPPVELQLERFASLIRRWRSSERFLHPVVELLRRAGHEGLVKSVRSERIQKTNEILMSSADHVDFSGQFMTRSTFERLKSEMERLNVELRTTVAQSLAKARALGDLRENAEYESAKQKQASHAERIASITLRLSQARLIEELVLPAGQIGPGHQVSVEQVGSGERHTYWLLGEGDDHFGPEVISYATPMGQSLLGKRVGDTVSFAGAEGTTTLRILAEERRLPPAIAVADSSARAAEAEPQDPAGVSGDVSPHNA